jgi:hypothetical protein
MILISKVAVTRTAVQCVYLPCGVLMDASVVCTTDLLRVSCGVACNTDRDFHLYGEINEIEVNGVVGRASL